MGAIRRTIATAEALMGKSTLIMLKAICGYGSPVEADNHDPHEDAVRC